MFKKSRIVITFVLAGLLAITGFGMHSEALAGDGQPPAPTEGFPAEGSSTSTTGSSANGGGMSIQSLNYLKIWGASLNKVSSTQLRASGFTETYGPVHEIEVSLILQVWSNNQNQWVDHVFIGETIGIYKSYISRTNNLTVPQGYYYRIKAEHAARDTGPTEWKTTYTGYYYM